MKNNLMVVKQLPIIEERLKTISDEIDRRISIALSMECTEETVKEVKKLRAELNKEKAIFEDERKEIKAAIMAPFEAFDINFDKYIKSKYEASDEQLKEKIDNTEDGIKEEKRTEVESYFNEYLQSKNIDFVTFGHANINITKSASMKSLKEQTKSFIDRIDSDLTLIDTQEHKVEILVEYKKNLNVSAAITEVVNRHIEINQEQEKAVKSEVVKEMEAQVVQKAESFAAPVVDEPKKKLTFSVVDTVPRLLALKKFLDDGGYQYE